MANRKRIVPEREGSPEAGFPVEGEASMNAHLVPRPRDARGLFHLPPRLKRAWPGPDVKKPGHFVAGPSLAEREGFEPPVPLRAHLFSRQTRSTTLAPLRYGAANIAEASGPIFLDQVCCRLLH